MLRKLSLVCATILVVLFTSNVFAAPCYVLSSADSGPTTLRDVATSLSSNVCDIKNVTNTDENNNTVDVSYPDEVVADQLISFATKDGMVDDYPNPINQDIRLQAPIDFNALTSAIVGNASPNMFDTSAAPYDPNAGYEPNDDGSIKDLGLMVIGAYNGNFKDGDVPFNCTGEVWIRNLVILTKAKSREDVFRTCKDGGANYVCLGGLASGHIDVNTLDPAANALWCNGILYGPTEKEEEPDTHPTDNYSVYGPISPEQVFSYKDSDGDGYYKRVLPLTFRTNGYLKYNDLPENAIIGDCNDNDEDIHAGATETPNDGIDQDCDGKDLLVEEICDDGIDNDGNGYTDCNDSACADSDYCVDKPTTETSCTDGIDNDGDGATDCDDTDCASDSACLSTGIDVDGDGVTSDVDCDDANATVYPGATELCDGIDNDCDGSIEGFVDMNGDGMVAGTNEDYFGVFDSDGDGLSDAAEAFWQTSQNATNSYNYDSGATDGEIIQQALAELSLSNEALSEITETCLAGAFQTAGPGGTFISCGAGSFMTSAESCAVIVENCSDGADNDNDGFVDCADIDCYGVVDTETGTACPDLSANPPGDGSGSSGCGCYLGETATMNFSTFIMSLLVGLGLIASRFSKK